MTPKPDKGRIIPFQRPRSPANKRKRLNKNNAAYRARVKKGIIILNIAAYSLRAETFCRRYCGLTGELTDAEIEQAITNFINQKGA